MHYIPDYVEGGDSVDKTGSTTEGSKRERERGRKSKKKGQKGSRNRSRSRSRPRKTKSPVPSSSSSVKSGHQKAATKLRNLMNRTFAKHKPSPINTTIRKTEQDALLPTPQGDIESQDSPASSISTSNNNFFPTNSNKGQDMWKHHNKQILLQGTPDTEEDDSTVGESYVYNHDDPTATDETPAERAERIQRAQDKIRQSMNFPLSECLLSIGVYIVLTVLCFSYWLEKDWTLIDSSYFAVTTFTTIGYGDVVPDTRLAQLFTCFWALSGVACLGIALGVLGSNLIEVHEQHMEKAQVHHQSRVIGLFDHYKDDLESRNIHTNSNATLGTRYSTIEEGKLRVMFDGMDDSDYDDESSRRFKRRLPQHKSSISCHQHAAALSRWVLLGCYIAGILYLIGQQEGWNLSKTVYYGVITASTVGYGDLSPQTEKGRFLAILFIPAAVALMGCFLEKVANTIIDRRRQAYTKQLHSEPLTIEQIRTLDSDGDGDVTMAEFLEFMLVAMNQVDKDLLEQLKQNFKRLDVDGNGTLNRADLAYMAKQGLSQQQMNLHGGERSKANVQKPVLERKVTKQTSNRSASPTAIMSLSSYQIPPNTYQTPPPMY